MTYNPMIRTVIDDRIAGLRHDADQERLAAIVRSASSPGRSGRGDRRILLLGALRVRLGGAMRAASAAIRADPDADCPDEALVEPAHTSAVRWSWRPERPNSPCA
jgi:hypothetical protein